MKVLHIRNTLNTFNVDNVLVYENFRYDINYTEFFNELGIEKHLYDRVSWGYVVLDAEPIELMNLPKHYVIELLDVSTSDILSIHSYYEWTDMIFYRELTDIERYDRSLSILKRSINNLTDYTKVQILFLYKKEYFIRRLSLEELKIKNYNIGGF